MTNGLSEFRQVFLPYCLDRQPDGRYAVLNRRYKPVGITRVDFVNYGDYPVLVRLKRQMSSAQIGAIDCRGRTDEQRIYLYDDECVPTESAAAWAAYSARLQRLAALQVEH